MKYYGALAANNTNLFYQDFVIFVFLNGDPKCLPTPQYS